MPDWTSITDGFSKLRKKRAAAGKERKYEKCERGGKMKSLHVDVFSLSSRFHGIIEFMFQYLT